MPPKSKSKSSPTIKSTFMIPVTPLSCVTPIVSTINTPTVVTPTYAIQTLTGHAPAFPLWNATTIYTTVYVGASSSPVAVGLPPSTITYIAATTTAVIVPQSVGTIGGAVATSTSLGNVTNVKVATTPTASTYTAGAMRTGSSLVAAFITIIGFMGL
ncbi:hypothetical protein BGZ60DRAFT_528817 [Tricladium varicosporioides]|nr:hypothetical protein BGZ60DRAFT_528817 [Hymenoscyphus varicosporioides]